MFQLSVHLYGNFTVALKIAKYSFSALFVANVCDVLSVRRVIISRSQLVVDRIRDVAEFLLIRGSFLLYSFCTL